MSNMSKFSVHGINCCSFLASIEQVLRKVTGVGIKMDRDLITARVETYASVKSLITAVGATSYDIAVVNSPKEVCS